MEYILTFEDLIAEFFLQLHPQVQEKYPPFLICMKQQWQVVNIYKSMFKVCLLSKMCILTEYTVHLPQNF